VGGGVAVFLMLTLFGGVSFRAGRSRFCGDFDDGVGGWQPGLDDRPVAREDVSDVGDDGTDPWFLWIGIWEAVAVALPDLTLGGFLPRFGWRV
jgi:hypothetical protein